MKQTAIDGMAPFFIVSHVPTSLESYCKMLGFEIVYRQPDFEPFFAILRRDAAMILIKQVAAEPLPNCKRDWDARWDAYSSVADPDALAAESTSRDVSFSSPIEDTYGGENSDAAERDHLLSGCRRFARPWMICLDVVLGRRN
jgi:catechol 2,3-dioxygenase-like lactoylglutathione lyase family enzyme